jgi:uncharacterized protein YndB with AHSA1/START domain
MKRLAFSCFIQAPPSKVWAIMLDPESYKEWTSAFCEGSYYEGSWEQGGRIRFLGPGENGIASVIAENRPHEFISIRHLAAVEKGVEIADSETVKSWSGALENYTFIFAGGGTELNIELDVDPAWEQMMTDSWPKALARLKALCEPTATPAPA